MPPAVSQSLPLDLQPSTFERFELPNGRIVRVPKAMPTFAPWAGKPPGNTFGGKAIVAHSGRPAFAELAILWSLQAKGWDGVWIDSYRRAFRQGYWGAEPLPELPPAPHALLDRIYRRAGRRGGAWDVMAWRGERMLFAESKRASRDAVRATQVRFLAAALALGLPLGSFLVVEWRLASARAQT